MGNCAFHDELRVPLITMLWISSGIPKRACSMWWTLSLQCTPIKLREVFSWKLDTCEQLVTWGRETWFLFPFENIKAWKTSKKKKSLCQEFLIFLVCIFLHSFKCLLMSLLCYCTFLSNNCLFLILDSFNDLYTSYVIFCILLMSVVILVISIFNVEFYAGGLYTLLNSL